MNTIKSMRERVAELALSFPRKIGEGEFSVLEIKTMAINRVRYELEGELEHSMNNPYGDGPSWAAARLTLFNSIYR